MIWGAGGGVTGMTGVGDVCTGTGAGGGVGIAATRGEGAGAVATAISGGSIMVSAGAFSCGMAMGGGGRGLGGSVGATRRTTTGVTRAILARRSCTWLRPQKTSTCNPKMPAISSWRLRGGRETSAKLGLGCSTCGGTTAAGRDGTAAGKGAAEVGATKARADDTGREEPDSIEKILTRMRTIPI